MSSYNKQRTKRLGPGGYKCPCCTLGTAKEHLKMETQRVRRTEKATLKKVGQQTGGENL